MKPRFLIGIVLFYFSFIPLMARDICKPLREYSIDVVSSVIDDSLEWQKKQIKFLNKDDESPLFLQKIYSLKDTDEIIISFQKDEFRKGYIPGYSKILFIKYQSGEFYIKDKAESRYKKTHYTLPEKYRKFTIAFIPLEQNGEIVIYSRPGKVKFPYEPRFYVLSARFVYLCKINVEHPFKKVQVPSPLSIRIPVHQVGYIIFTWNNSFYKLNVFKGLDGKDKLFTYYSEPNSTIGKFMELKKRRGNYFIIDFNKSYYHYCTLNSNIKCPEQLDSNTLSLMFPAGEQSNEPR